MFSVEKVLSDSFGSKNDDAPDAKKVELDSTLTKKAIKKPILNYEILEEIFSELLEKRYCHMHGPKSRVTKNIENFMASGREPFQIGMNYFKKIHKVNAYSNEMWVHPPESKIFKNDIRQQISYTCVFLKSILKSIKFSIKNLQIIKNSAHIWTKDALPLIYETLIIEGLEDVYFSSINIPEKYIHKLCNISTIKKFYAPLKITDLPLIQFKISKFDFSTDFKNFLDERSQKICMPWIEELCIRGNFEISDITEKTMQLFVNSINEIFPNLKILKAFFDCKNSTWKPGYEKMKEFEPKWLNGFPATLKGYIDFFSSIDQLKYKVFCQYRDEDSEYIVDIGRAIKEFNIHDGFTFEFQLRD